MGYKSGKCYFLLTFDANRNPSHAMGRYAKPRSAIVNQTGEGSIKTDIIPPARNITPIT